RRRLDDGKPHHERAALLPPLAERLGGAAVQAHQVPDDRESEAEAARRPLEALALLGEHVEDTPQHVGIDADAGVADAERDLVTRALGEDRHAAASFG